MPLKVAAAIAVALLEGLGSYERAGGHQAPAAHPAGAPTTPPPKPDRVDVYLQHEFWPTRFH